MEMSTHPRNTASEVAHPRCRIGVLECLISLRRLVGGAIAATNIKPKGLHFIKAGRHGRDVLPGHGQDGITGILDHVHQLGEESDIVIWTDVVACLVRPVGESLISICWPSTILDRCDINLPIDTDISGCSFVSGGEELIPSARGWTDDRRSLRVRKHGVM